MFHMDLPITLWLFNIAMENDPFIDDFPIADSIYKGFSLAMLDIQMVNLSYYLSDYYFFHSYGFTMIYLL